MSIMNQKGDHGTFLQLKRVDEKTEAATQYQQDVEAYVTQQLGVRRVLNLICENKPLVVAHNGFLDLCHVYSKFINPLPELLVDFKREILQMYSAVMDTKYMIESYPQLKGILPSTSLDECYKAVTTSNLFGGVSISLDNEYGEERLHEAGYDSYVTGYIFLRISEFIGKQRDKLFEGVTSFGHLQDFRNMIWMVFSDVQLDLSRAEQFQDRSNVFTLTDIKPDLVNDDIRAELKMFGKFRIDWVNSTLAYIVLDDKGKTDSLKEAIREGKLKLNLKPPTSVFLESIVETEEPGKKRKRDDDPISMPPPKKNENCVVA